MDFMDSEISEKIVKVNLLTIVLWCTAMFLSMLSGLTLIEAYLGWELPNNVVLRLWSLTAILDTFTYYVWKRI